MLFIFFLFLFPPFVWAHNFGGNLVGIFVLSMHNTSHCILSQRSLIICHHLFGKESNHPDMMQNTLQDQMPWHRGQPTRLCHASQPQKFIHGGSLQGRSAFWWTVVEGASQGQCFDWGRRWLSFHQRRSLGLPWYLRHMPDSRQKYKARFRFANSGINSHIITKPKAKRELQNWDWSNTRALSDGNLCVGLTSALLLVSRKLAGLISMSWISLFITACKYVESRNLNYRSAIFTHFLFQSLPGLMASYQPGALKQRNVYHHLRNVRTVDLL